MKGNSQGPGRKGLGHGWTRIGRRVSGITYCLGMKLSSLAPVGSPVWVGC